ncbi:MAG: hypothetical protein ACR2OV_01825 [Hyphomicrobiaceae bacterium]
MPNPLTVLRKNIAIGWHVMHNNGDFVHRDLRLTIPRTVKRDVRHMIVSGDYENEEFDLVSKWVPPSRSVIELGGCLGVVSAHLRRTIDPDQTLIVVEANPEIVGTCEENATRPSPASPTEVVCGAVAYGVDEVAFHLRRNLHVSRIADDAGEANHVCRAYTLADLASRLPASARFTLVCDIEGGEFDLFRHDQQTLAFCDLAIVETHPSMFERAQDKLDEMAENAAQAGLEIVDETGDVIVLKRE